VADTGIIDCTRESPSLRTAIASGIDMSKLAARNPDFKLADVAFAPTIPDPDKIICVGLNYKSHIAEVGREPPAYPMIFTRFANSQVGHDQPMLRPRVSDNFDFEGELAVIIGKRGRSISRSQALDHVAGYSCYNDGSVRDWQRHTSQFTPGKNFAQTGGFGPWMVTADEMGEIGRQRLETRLNGEVMQKTTLDDLLFDVPAIIEYCSTFTELVPGDVLVTGTTGGVGVARKPQLWMKPGDVVEVEIDGIGTLRNTIAQDL
jgi:2-keto-4-pentenoate hydratase/2-oxohepta-3-ene-1,7-dioic acid hydratase in catechol pathway